MLATLKPACCFASRTGLLIVAALFLSGCGSTPKGKGDANLTQEEILTQEDVKKNPPIIMNYPHEKVHEAALRGLTTVGCEIQRNEPFFVSGKRPNKFGLFVGSGGETVKIFLLPSDDPSTTKVWVDTDMSFVGIAGQQGWNEQVVKAMYDVLAEGK